MARIFYTQIFAFASRFLGAFRVLLQLKQKGHINPFYTISCMLQASSPAPCGRWTHQAEAVTEAGTAAGTGEQELEPELELQPCRPFSFASCHFYALFFRIALFGCCWLYCYCYCCCCFCCCFCCCCLALKMFYVVCDLRNLLCTCFNEAEEKSRDQQYYLPSVCFVI